ncbi:MAG: tetraacyldisaccharide 4'-kinase, partial [Kiritimatiellae bacterium]|nr:tetraacyldisaccharide 4'-kinase [Kiritimatiellia bacterium]
MTRRPRRSRQSGVERLEKYIVHTVLDEDGSDSSRPLALKLFLALLSVFEFLFSAVVCVRNLLYKTGVLRCHHLGIQVVSIGN